MGAKSSRGFVVLSLLSVVAVFLSLPRPLNPLAFVLGAVATVALARLGLAAAASLGWPVPLLDGGSRMGLRPRVPVSRLLASGLAGAAVGLALTALIVFVLLPVEPLAGARLKALIGQPFWRPWAVSFEASVTEEVVCRLFLMSGVAWLLTRLARPRDDRPRPWMTIVAGAASVLAFGLIHNTPWLQAVADPGVGLLAVVVGLNAIGGAVFSAAFWAWGIEAAIFAHFCADMVVQGIGPGLIAGS